MERDILYLLFVASQQKPPHQPREDTAKKNSIAPSRLWCAVQTAQHLKPRFSSQQNGGISISKHSTHIYIHTLLSIYKHKILTVCLGSVDCSRIPVKRQHYTRINTPGHRAQTSGRLAFCTEQQQMDGILRVHC